MDEEKNSMLGIKKKEKMAMDEERQYVCKEIEIIAIDVERENKKYKRHG